MKIKIKNYQRIEDLEINLSPGINLITGNSNNGKSSTIRAIRDFVFNKFSNDKIRHGETKLEVTLDDVKSFRTKLGTVFDIKGELMEKVGRNPLQEVYDIFKISELDVNGVSIKPNFWFQMDKPFLFDKTAGQKHDLIIGSKNDKYLKALKSIKNNQNYLSKTETKSIKDSINLIKKQNLDTEIELGKLKGIEDLYKEIEEFEKEKIKYEKTMSIIGELKRLNQSSSALKLTLENINSLLTEYDIYSEEFKDINKTIDIISKLDDYENNINNLNKINNGLSSIGTMLNSSEKINNDISELISEYDTFDKIKSVATNYKNNNYSLKTIDSNLDELESEIFKKNSEIDKIKKELKYCPTCNKEF
ncbi:MULTISPECIES: AAA family ATPase [Bacteria]|uniref:AAA family ATPase n=1 Tax=Bacteria TaxID=2 RepID=UPI003F3FDA79